MQGFRAALTRVRTPVLRRIKAQNPIIITHKAPQLLQLQSSFLPASFSRFYNQSFSLLEGISSISSTQINAMANSTPDPNIDKVLKFWLHDHSRQDWFKPDDPVAFDEQITTQFKSLLDEARETTNLDHWADTPTGALALVILLDQFSRNIYRLPHPDAHLSFASDAKALQIATDAIAKDFDRQLPSFPSAEVIAPCFFYVPFMHAEDMVAQIASVAFYENLLNRCGDKANESEKEFMTFSIQFSKMHLHCVRKMGKFPKRNEALGREMTEADRKWLEDHPNGF